MNKTNIGVKINRSDELRVAFRALAGSTSVRLSDAKFTSRKLFAALNSIGFPVLTLEIKNPLIQSFTKHGGFGEDDFVEIALSLGYEELAEERVAAAMLELSEKSLVDANKLERLLAIHGKDLKLSRDEIKAFLLFQLGEKTYMRPKFTVEIASQLIN
jgi:hypothetical protein